MLDPRLLAALAVAAFLAGAAVSCGGGGKSASPPAAASTGSTTTTTTTTGAGTTTGTTPGTTTGTTTTGTKQTPRGAAALILQLLKAPAKGSLPPSLEGSTTQATALSAGSRKHRAAGAIATTNGGALVGYLVFKTRSDALADLKAFPPNSGPNKLIQRDAPGYPKPSYVLRAVGNGYVGRYVVYVAGPVIVDAWAYGQAGKKREQRLLELVEANAQWALQRLAKASQTAGFGASGAATVARQSGVVHGPATAVPGKTVRFTVTGLRGGSTVTATLAPADAGGTGVGVPGSFAVSLSGTAVLSFRFPTTYRRCASPTGACTHPAWRDREKVVLRVSGYLESAQGTVTVRRSAGA